MQDAGGVVLHHFRFIFLLAIALHLAWGGLLLYSPAPGGATPIHQTVVAFGRYPAAIVLFVVAALALASIVFNLSSWFLLPQASILIAASAGGLYAVSVSHYADGVMRPWPFILADQLPTILLAVFHTVAVCIVYAIYDASKESG